MRADLLLAVDGLEKRFGALKATDGLDLEVRTGEIHALIGPNGAGKSTLMKQLSGEMKPDAGRILFRGADITYATAPRRARLGIARSYQITSIFPDYSVLENVATAVQMRMTGGAGILRRAKGDADIEEPALKLIERVGLSGAHDRLASALAHGQQRQLECAMALALEPSLLLLDEPMAGMGPQESAIMVELLRGLRGQVTTLLVEHDMDAVFSLADRITVLVYGKAIATGSPDEIRNNPTVREAYLGGEADAS